ncbi:MAG: bifunctional diaminohydroxyphosphoribosylaminopyrimidine deaminase/5-amino-6-(5-phosphoribosylamino)uracil reductase RibD [Planctomycetes bacterium]|nr:bifunctional diaminohydroxyphosphoribosylaminopyrimidine deaminase/5-amino-6-(5-phosphoribosylamino)uracil reductase RibD [Planctomycetota bacterium]
MQDIHEEYMMQAIELSRRGIGSVEPNPPVGCVIVAGGEIIGAGWHEEFGKGHAEINAIADCKSNGNDTTGADMYVSLEPCCHIGKTAPCSDAVIEAKIGRVFIGSIDPSSNVGGKGIEQLQRAGVEVAVGICTEAAQAVMAPFIKYVRTHQPWVIVKWAQSADGVIGFGGEVEDRWISNKTSQADAHNLRRRVQAIVVGIETVLTDDPLLTPRPGKGRKPKRIVLDSQLRIPLTCQLLNTPGYPTAVMTTEKTANEKQSLVKEIIEKGAEVIAVKEADGKCDIREVMTKLGEMGAQQVLVEGGAKVITSVLQAGLADEVRVYIADKKLACDGAVMVTKEMEALANAEGLTNYTCQRLGNDKCVTGCLKVTS